MRKSAKPPSAGAKAPPLNLHNDVLPIYKVAAAPSMAARCTLKNSLKSSSSFCMAGPGFLASVFLQVIRWRHTLASSPTWQSLLGISKKRHHGDF